MRRTPWVALALLAGCRAEPVPVRVGNAAPAYAATLMSGDSVRTSGFKGKVLLLNVWATWCAPCREEIPFLQTLYTTHHPGGLEIVGVSIDARGSDETITSFAREMGMTYPIWRDPDERVQSVFMALGVPATYLIDRLGVLRWRRLGVVRASDTTFSAALAAALAGNGD